MLGNLFRSTLGRLRPASTPDEVRQLAMRKQFDEALAALRQLHPATPKRELAQACLQAEIAFRQGRDAPAE